jgi:hypothetical protein
MGTSSDTGSLWVTLKPLDIGSLGPVPFPSAQQVAGMRATTWALTQALVHVEDGRASPFPSSSELLPVVWVLQWERETLNLF